MATNLHKNSDENNKHTPKGFSSASNMDKLLRDEKGESTYTRNNQLPSAINFVDGNAAPPTSVSGNIYVLIDQGNGAVNSAWDGASYNDWVRYDGTLWYAITPENGDFCFDQNAGIYKLFSSSAWADFDNASNIMNTNGLTLLGNYTHDLSTNTLAFNNGSVLLNASSKVASEDILLSGETYIQRASTSSADTVLSLLDNVNTELWDFRANGDVYTNQAVTWYLGNKNLVINRNGLESISIEDNVLNFDSNTIWFRNNKAINTGVAVDYNQLSILNNGTLRHNFAPASYTELFRDGLTNGRRFIVGGIQSDQHNYEFITLKGRTAIIDDSSSNTTYTLELANPTNTTFQFRSDGAFEQLQNQPFVIAGNTTFKGGARHLGYTSSTAAPTTTELPSDKDYAIHKDTLSGTVYLAYNDGGVIKTVTLT